MYKELNEKNQSEVEKNFKKTLELLEKAEPLKKIAHISRGGSSAVTFGIVNSKNNGKRISASRNFLNKLQNPTHISFSIVKDEGVLIVGESLPNIEKSYEIKNPEKPIIYDTSLVLSLVDAFQLDYSKVTSKSFSDITFETLEDGKIVAFIHIPKEPKAS